MGDAHRLPLTGNMLVIWAHCVAPATGQVYSNSDMSGTFFNEFHMPSLLREYARNGSSEVVFELELYDPDETINWGIYGGLMIPGLYSTRGGS